MNVRPEAWRFLAKHAGFRRLWITTTASELGSVLSRVAFILLVHQRAVDTGAVPEKANALMLLAETVPAVFLGPIAGALVDRYDKRKLLVRANLVQALLIGSVPMLARLDVTWPLYAIAMCVAAVATIFQPALQSSVPDLVGLENVATANGISSSTTSLVFVAGAALAGVILASFGHDACFWINSASFLFAAIMLVPLAIPRHGVDRHGVRELLRESLDGLRYARSRADLTWLFAAFLMAFVFIGVWFPIVPQYFEHDIGVSADTWVPRSWMAFGLGGIVGGAIGPLIGRAVGMGRAIVLTYFVEPFLIASYCLPTNAWVVIVLSFLWGVLAFAYFVQEKTVLQEEVPAELRGRVFGLLAPLQALGTFTANVIVFEVGGLILPRTFMLVAGASYLALSIVLTLAMASGARGLWLRPRKPTLRAPT